MDGFISASDLRFSESLCCSLMDARIHLVFLILKGLKAEDERHQAEACVCVYNGILATKKRTVTHK